MAAPSQTGNDWRVLIDLNVLLDVLMWREPFFGDAARLWALVETGQVGGFVAGHTFTTGCDYIVTRNTQDYLEQPVAAIQPADFLAVWAADLE